MILAFILTIILEKYFQQITVSIHYGKKGTHIVLARRNDV